ncbi:MAG: insulinase family protein [Prevotella sp.]|nr:insulinase family protein [Prevotella sp.]
MKLKKLFAAAALLIVSVTAIMAQEMQLPPVPVDPAVRTGKLSNGLTYYIRQNGYPEHRVNFYIAQRVGSIQEEEDQRGLAHFLEHMAFNGSEHYKGNDLIEYLRSIGVEFGSDLNAYTAVDQTVYRICNVPSTRESALDSCLLVIKDWSNGLLLEEDEINKERGVIHEEWRLRMSPIMRVLERNLETLYPGSKYGKRFPIGLMEVVDNFSPEFLRDYYHKWYRPDNQAVIVVGDVDVDKTEQKIKDLFSSIPLAENAAQVVAEEVPDNNEPIIIIDKDKEQTIDMVQLSFKHDAVPDAEKNSIAYLLNKYAIDLVCSMLNARFEEISQEEDCPFLNAEVEDGDYIYSRTKGSFDVTFLPKEGKDVEALTAAMREVMRALKHGFTATEFERAKADYLSSLEKVYTNRDKRDNSVYGNIYSQNYIANEPMPSIEDEYMMMQQVSPMIPVEAINQVLPELVSQTDTNVVILAIYNEKDGKVYPTAEAFKKVIDTVHSEEIEAWVDEVRDEPLISELPAKGAITSETENTELGYKELMLSNGVKVLLKKTDYKDDEVLLQAVSKGGTSLLGEEDIINAKVFDQAIGVSGLGNFSNTELSKALAGKQVNADLSLSLLHERVTGNSTPKDLETMFQMVYLYFTDIRKDEKSFALMMNMLENALKNKEISPDMAFSDSLKVTLYDHNPRFKTIELADLQKVDYDRILQIAKERTANAADFTFTFVGNFDEEVIRPLIEQYIASLPASGEKEEWKAVTTYNKGKVENKFLRKMETAKANAYMYWYNNDIPYSIENDIYADAAGQVLSMIYLQKIREDASAAYSTGAIGMTIIGNDVPFTALVGICPMKPEMSDVALKIMREEAEKMAETVDPDMLSKVKELMLKRADEDAMKNKYWLGILSNYNEYGIDQYTDYKKIVNELTPEKLAKFVKDVIFGGGNSVTVIMLPDESE